MHDCKKYLRMLASIVIAIVIVSIYGKISTGPIITPAQAKKVKNYLSGLKFNPNSVIRLFTLNFSSTDNNGLVPIKNGVPSFALPTVIQVTPSTQTTLIPINNIVPTIQPSCFSDACLTVTPASPIQPTQPPSPTKAPKPTKAPNTFPIDPSLTRPGTTTDEVFDYASQKTCVPVAVLKGIAYIESGSFFDVVSPEYFLLYNSYNWWKSQYLTDVKRACGGYDYASNTGIIPSDSNFAGQSCNSGQGGDLVTMGPLSVSDYWEGKYIPQAAKLLGVSQADQRVILDAITIVALSVKENVKPANCNSWTAHEVAKAACSYYGSCGFKDGTYYCNTFCRNYTKYGGKAACQTAVNQMQDNCWQ